MAKRYSDTDKWKKPFIRSLQGAYKLLWFYILDDCDHAGIWQVDQDVAELRVGMSIDWEKVPQIFNEKIIFIDENKWFVPDFIEFQYGMLNPQNRVHFSVISLLEKYDLLKFLEKNKGLTSPLQGAKDKDKDKDKDKEIEGGLGETFLEPEPDIASESLDDIEPIQVQPEDFPEEEFAAALEYYKSQSFYAITRKQFELDEKTIDDYFRRFYEKRFGELLLDRKRLFDAYKTQMELIKHFYNMLPYLKKTIAETTPKTQKNGNTNLAPRQSGNSFANAEQRRADRGKLTSLANAVLLGAQAKQ